MRIKINLLSDKPSSLPLDFRRYFMSFIKSIFCKTGCFEKAYETKKAKPFVFSLWLGKDFSIEKKDINLDKNINFLFSSGDNYIVTNFYNGLIVKKNNNETFSLGQTRYKIEKVSLLPIRKITSNKILCRTVGISVVTKPNGDAKDFNKWYITPCNDLLSFNNALKMRVNERYKYIKGEEKNFNIELKPLNDDELNVLKFIKKTDNIKGLDEIVVKHYDGYLKGFKGFFWLEGDIEALEFVYDFGLGVRTAQGFGMIELIG